MAAVFALSALVQFNDPDPVGWILLYGAAFAIALCATVISIHPAAPLILLAVSLCWATFLLPPVWQSSEPLSLSAVFGSVSMKNERVELVREIGGLLIVSAYLALLSLRRKT